MATIKNVRDGLDYRSVIAYTIIAIILLYVVEQVIQMPYVLKTLIKLPMFTVLPWMVMKGQSFSLNLFGFPKASRPLLLLSIVVMVTALLITYGIASRYVDTSLIISDFSDRMRIGQKAMIVAALYTSFVNSFIEEYFFRGFIFQGINKRGHRGWAYMFSAGAFALYHVTIFLAWFNGPLLLLALIVLLIGGLIFAFFAEKTQSLVGSWFIHMVADIVIISLGLFGLGIYYV